LTDGSRGRFCADNERWVLDQQVGDHARQVVTSELFHVRRDIEKEQYRPPPVGATQLRCHFTGEEPRLPHPARRILNILS
jgi:hypothetical protein